MVLLVRLEVGGERLDLLRENRDLDFGGTRVAVVTLEFGLDGGLVDLHFIYSFSLFCVPGSKTLPVVPTWDTERPNFEHPRQG
jgi:hypothetical protein